ncbi:retinol dehydrogenase 7-like [Pseudophryne corroboree]|uniref:retinol dehydrogenase 7-like n=1 Tax=Pseudophryne corroboree TaxID=495146 RepID=UPI0030818FF7
MIMWLDLLALLGLILMYRWYRQSQILENLTDKYVFITGCDSGFGNLLARNLDRRGMRVLAACLTDRGVEELRKETSSRLQTVILDVTDSQSVSSAAKWASTIVGDKGLWGLVNNAGVSVPSCTNEWLKKDDFFKVLNVNLLGVIDVTINLLPLIRKAKGRIVNVSSIVGRITISPGGYCMSKYGVESFSDSLRREMRPFKVKVCILEPGFYNSNITSGELIQRDMKRSWESLSEEVKQSYGDEYYKKCLSYVDGFAQKCNKNLSLVTDCMEHALTAVHPWTRYTAGWDAKLIFIPLSYLPTVILDFLLTIGQPKPAQAD